MLNYEAGAKTEAELRFKLNIKSLVHIGDRAKELLDKIDNNKYTGLKEIGELMNLIHDHNLNTKIIRRELAYQDNICIEINNKLRLANRRLAVFLKTQEKKVLSLNPATAQ